MNLDDAIRFWTTETGYRKIQSLFSKRIHSGKSKYALNDMIENENNMSDATNAINIIRNNMIPANKNKTYYRGSPSRIDNNHLREGFFAVTTSKKKATSYGDVYKVIINKNVPRISFSAEGDETLILDGMLYKYDKAAKEIHVSVPKNNNTFPYLGNLYQTRKKALNNVENKKTQFYLDKLYRCSFEEPDKDLGFIGECPDKGNNNDFETKTLLEQFSILNERLNTLKKSGVLEQFLNDLELNAIIPKEDLNKILKSIKDLQNVNLLNKKEGGKYKKTRRNKRYN
jgi:hypothetical protein